PASDLRPPGRPLASRLAACTESGYEAAMSWLALLTAASLALWLYLLLGRHGFWRARPRIEEQTPRPPTSWPPVVAVVPARNEADHVPATLPSLLGQDYPGEFAVVLVYDHSTVGTCAMARRLGGAGVYRLAVRDGA